MEVRQETNIFYIFKDRCYASDYLPNERFYF